MDIDDAWNKALANTEIIRARVLGLNTFERTHVGYVLLSASSVNAGDTVVRKGQIAVDKPSLIVPPHLPRFEGFDIDQVSPSEDALINFLMVRGISLPSMTYNNTHNTLDVFEGSVSEAIAFHGNRLQRAEDTATGLLVGPEDVWPFSLLIFVCTQIARNTDADIRRLLDEHRRRREA